MTSLDKSGLKILISGILEQKLIMRRGLSSQPRFGLPLDGSGISTFLSKSQRRKEAYLSGFLDATMTMCAYPPGKGKRRVTARLSTPTFFDRPLLDCFAGMYPADDGVGLSVVQHVPGQYKLVYDLSRSTIASPFLSHMLDPDVGLLSHKLNLLGVLCALVSRPNALPAPPAYLARVFNRMPQAWCDAHPARGPGDTIATPTLPGMVGDYLSPYAAVDFSATKLGSDCATVPLRHGPLAAEWATGFLDGQLALRYDRVGLIPRPMLITACDPHTLPTLSLALGAPGVLWRSPRKVTTSTAGAGWVWALYGDAACHAAAALSSAAAAAAAAALPPAHPGAAQPAAQHGGSVLWGRQFEAWATAAALYRNATAAPTAEGGAVARSGEPGTLAAAVGATEGPHPHAGARADATRTRIDADADPDADGDADADADGAAKEHLVDDVTARTAGGGIAAAHPLTAKSRRARAAAARARALRAGTTAAARLSEIADDVATRLAAAGTAPAAVGVSTVAALIRLQALQQRAADAGDADAADDTVVSMRGSLAGGSLRSMLRRLRNDDLVSITGALAVRMVHGTAIDEAECRRLIDDAATRASVGGRIGGVADAAVVHPGARRAHDVGLVADEMVYLYASAGIREAAGYVDEAPRSTAGEHDRRGSDNASPLASAGPLVLQYDLHRQLLRRPDQFVRMPAPPALPTAAEALAKVGKGTNAV